MWGAIRLAALAAFGASLGACGRIDDAQPSVGRGGAGGAFGTSMGGGAGQLTLNVPPASSAGAAGFYPPPFNESSCPAPVSSASSGGLRCMTRAELEDMRLFRVLVDGGVSALGAPGNWRCPQLAELLSSGSCGGEGSCCHIPLCGPLTDHSSSPPSDAGSAGASGDSGSDTQLCCYYVDEVCGV